MASVSETWHTDNNQNTPTTTIHLFHKFKITT